MVKVERELYNIYKYYIKNASLALKNMKFDIN